MPISSPEAKTQTLPPVPASASGGVGDTARIAVRPVFVVDDGGRRKRLLVRTGYLGAAACVVYLAVVVISVTAGPAGPLAGLAGPLAGLGARPTAIQTPAAAAVGPRAVAPHRADVPDVDRDGAVAPTPASVARRFAAPLGADVTPGLPTSRRHPGNDSPRPAKRSTKPAASTSPAPSTAPSASAAPGPTPTTRSGER